MCADLMYGNRASRTLKSKFGPVLVPLFTVRYSGTIGQPVSCLQGLRTARVHEYVVVSLRCLRNSLHIHIRFAPNKRGTAEVEGLLRFGRRKAV